MLALAMMDYFVQCGLPAWRSMTELPGCVGAPLLELHTRFHKSSTHGERLQLHTTVEAWRGKVFVLQHRVLRGETLICEGRETRALCVRDDSGQLKAIPVPGFILSACTASSTTP